MDWNIFFYETSRGEKLVKDFIKAQEESTIAKINHKIDLLRYYGPYLSLPHARKLSGQLYELRIRGRDEIRILYAFIQNAAYLLHGFKKKTQEIPEKEIVTTLERLKTLTKL